MMKNDHKGYMKKYNKEQRKIKRGMIFEHYGKKCICCGEQNYLFLTLDHTNNDGAKHRKEIGLPKIAGYRFYCWVVQNNYPDGLQILCMNCNFGKRMNNGMCPHLGINNF